MSIKFHAPESPELKPRIVVFGVGGAGGNAVNNMLTSELMGVEFVVANTDAQALIQNLAPRKIQLGQNVTLGLGAGSKPEIGAQAAEASAAEIEDVLTGSHMTFITAGMGGGTGTGAAPVIARIAREMGILTVGVVTKPFHFEGDRRMRQAEAGIAQMQDIVDTLIVIPNQNLFRVANEKTTLAQSFAMADEVLHSGVRGITDLMIVPGLMNLDFADVRTVMMEMGKAMMGTGEAEGPKRALDAAEAAISNPLLDDVSMKGAKGVLIHITGGPDLTLFEADEAANRIRSEVDAEANIKVGSTFDAKLEGRIRVSVVATGIDAHERAQPKPVTHAPVNQIGRAPIRTQPVAAPAPAAAPVTAQLSLPENLVAAQPEIFVRPAAPQPNPVHAMQTAAEEKLQADLASQQKALDEARAKVAEAEAAISRQRQAPQPVAATVTRPTVTFDDFAISAESGGIRGGVSEPMARPGLTPEAPTGIMGTIGGLFTRSKAKRAETGPQTRYQPEPEATINAPRPIEPRFADPAAPRATARTVKAPETPSLFASSPAEDPLEIPAFLRRQANS
ncbi:Cell division protein FtsZ [Alphaproteobacteria bacterium SO-S41]|nr:Cell division protein FtsZ [Alphaproteobacteria bacterium SO-S41]